MSEFKVNTPFARVTVVIDKKDEWAHEDIEDWVCTELTGTSRKRFNLTMQKFENMRKKLSLRGK